VSGGVRFRHRLEYALVRGVAILVCRLPQRIVVAGGDALGLAFYALDARHRRLTVSNLSLAFPRRSHAEISSTARRVFRHFGRMLMEMLRLSGLPPARLRELCVFDGVEHAHQALRQGRGALFITGHFGFWEIQALAHGLAHEPIAVVARALDNPLLHDLLERTRTSTGNTVIYRRGGLRRILRALQQNVGVAMLIDQHIQAADAVMVDFFGRPASTTSAVAVLAFRTGAPVVPVFALPLDDGRYRLVYEPPVDPPPDDSPDSLRDFTQRCTDVLEMYVRRHPHLWLWMHKRWRDDETADPGMFPRAGDGAAVTEEDEGGRPSTEDGEA
jgi:KDO2-lipid IV(A) lauroyltransferase